MKFTDGLGHDEPDINVIPLIDVILVLLIFFMASATFEDRSRIRVQLPEASPEEISRDPGPILTVQIDEQGRYFVNTVEVLNTRIETLKQVLVLEAGDDRDQRVIIRADARTPHQAVVTAMDALGQLGFTRLSIATVQRRDE